MSSTPPQPDRPRGRGPWGRRIGAVLAVVGAAALLAAVVAPLGSSGRDLAAPSATVAQQAAARFVPIQTEPNPHLALNVVADRLSGLVHVEWEANPDLLAPRTAADIVGYEVWVRSGGTTTKLPHSGTDPTLVFPWDGSSHYEDLGVGLRVVVHFDGSAPLALPSADEPLPSWTLPRLTPLPPYGERWATGSIETVATDAERVAAFGPTAAWIDGNIGFTTIDETDYAFAANGENVSRWEVGTDRFLDPTSLRDDAGYDGTTIEVSGDDNPYAAGGPVYLDEGDPQDATDDQLLMLYHGEVWQGPNVPANGFWGYIGLARSVDAGRSWTSLGPIIEPELGVASMDWPDSKEIGGAPYVIQTDPADGQEYLHVYFRDTDETQRPLNLSVARAPLGTVLAAARNGVAPMFEKWDGAWAGEPGLGGSSTDLLAGQPTPRWWDVTYLDLDDEPGSGEDRGMYVLAYSDNNAGGRWTTMVRTSEDGLSWSAPERVTAFDDEDEVVYLSLSAPPGKGTQRHIEGNAIDLYRTRSDEPIPDRWVDASIERLRLTFVGPDTEGP